MQAQISLTSFLKSYLVPQKDIHIIVALFDMIKGVTIPSNTIRNSRLRNLKCLKITAIRCQSVFAYTLCNQSIIFLLYQSERIIVVTTCSTIKKEYAGNFYLGHFNICPQALPADCNSESQYKKGNRELNILANTL